MKTAHAVALTGAIGIVLVILSVADRSESHQELRFADARQALQGEKRLSGRDRRRARVEFFQRMLRDPATGRVPRNIRQRELDHARLISRQVVAKDGNVDFFDWVGAGPTDVGGRTRALAIDVTNANVIVAGGVSGGIWKSVDGGLTWQPKTDPSQHHGVTSIAQDPRPGHTDTWYYATGEWLGTEQDRGNAALYFGGGLYKSIDGGESWSLVLDAGLFDEGGYGHADFDFISKVIVNPASGSVFIACNGYGVYRSADGGSSFDMVLGGRGDHFWADIDVHEASGRMVAALSRGEHPQPAHLPGIYRSDDDGVRWKRLPFLDEVPGFPQFPARSVLTFTSDSNTVYVMSWTGATGTTVEQARLHRFRLDSLANTPARARMQRGPLPDFGSPFGGIEMQLGYNMAIAVRPDDPEFLLLGATNLFRSVDGFATEADTSDWIGGYARRSTSGDQFRGHHADQHALVFDSRNPRQLWSAHDGGISVLEDVGAPVSTSSSWVNRDSGYVVTQYYAVAIAAVADDDRLVGGTQDNGTVYFRATPEGVQKKPSSDLTGGDGGYAYLGSGFAYVSNQFGAVTRLPYDNEGDPDPSSCPGLSCRVEPAEATGQLFVNPFAVDPVDESVMYYAAGDSLWRTRQLPDETGFTGWSAVMAVPSGYIISALAASRAPGHVLYVGASSRSCCSVPVVFRVENAADSLIGAVTPYEVPATSGAYLHSIAANPLDADDVLVVLSNYGVESIFHSVDGGGTLVPVEGNLGDTGGLPGPSVRAAAIVPLGGGSVYLAATSTGLYATDALAGSATVWIPQGEDVMGRIIVESLASRAADGRVAAGSHGRGLFVGSPSPAVATEPPSTVPATALFQNYPNPFSDRTTVSYTLAEAGEVSLTVFDIAGRRVARIVDRATTSAGRHHVDFSAHGLAAGTYAYRLEVETAASGHSAETKTMTVVH